MKSALIECRCSGCSKQFHAERTFLEMIWRKGNLRTLEIGFGTRDSKEKELLKTEIKKVEEEFQKWI